MKVPGALQAIAATRHGAVTSAEARAALSRSAISRRIDAGQLLLFRRGVLIVAKLRDELSGLAALQLLHPELVAERCTAGAVWRLDGCGAVPWTGLDVFQPGPRRRLAVPARVADVASDAVTTHRGIRVTTAARTLADLGDSPSVTVDEVELAVESALHRGLTSEATLRGLASAHSGLGRALARRRPGDPPTESYAETRFLQTIARPLGLEDPERQVRLLTYRADFVFRRERALDVEIDGGEFHGTASAHERDVVRDHHLRREGCHVVRFPAGRLDSAPSSTRSALLAELRAVT